MRVLVAQITHFAWWDTYTKATRKLKRRPKRLTQSFGGRLLQHVGQVSPQLLVLVPNLSSLRVATSKSGWGANDQLLGWISGLVVEEGFSLHPLHKPGVQSPNHQ